MKPSLDDSLWPAAQSFGRFGVAAPWHHAASSGAQGATADSGTSEIPPSEIATDDIPTAKIPTAGRRETTGTDSSSYAEGGHHAARDPIKIRATCDCGDPVRSVSKYCASNEIATDKIAPIENRRWTSRPIRRWSRDRRAVSKRWPSSKWNG